MNDFKEINNSIILISSNVFQAKPTRGASSTASFKPNTGERASSTASCSQTRASVPAHRCAHPTPRCCPCGAAVVDLRVEVKVCAGKHHHVPARGHTTTGAAASRAHKSEQDIIHAIVFMVISRSAPEILNYRRPPSPPKSNVETKPLCKSLGRIFFPRSVFCQHCVRG